MEGQRNPCFIELRQLEFNKTSIDLLVRGFRNQILIRKKFASDPLVVLKAAVFCVCLNLRVYIWFVCIDNLFYHFASETLCNTYCLMIIDLVSFQLFTAGDNGASKIEPLLAPGAVK